MHVRLKRISSVASLVGLLEKWRLERRSQPRNGSIRYLGRVLLLLFLLFGMMSAPKAAYASSKVKFPRVSTHNGFIPRPLALWNAHGVTLGSYPQIWYSPLNLKPIVPGASSAEGTWSPIGTNAGPGYATFATYVTPYAGAPQVAVAWINQDYARLSLYAGTSQPGGSWPNQGAIPPSLQPSLIAAFEGGFLFNQSEGGWYQGGKYGQPLVNGAASVVNFRNGTVDIGAWGVDVSMSPNVYAVRQNLIPLVSGGAVLPSATYDPLVTWGFSLGNLLYTWRSGLGITANGALIWVGGPGLSPAALGNVLVWAGAVRGMQLDMNPYWVNFASYSYSPLRGTSGSNLLAAMHYPPSHYLNGFWRDFIAVFLR